MNLQQFLSCLEAVPAGISNVSHWYFEVANGSLANFVVTDGIRRPRRDHDVAQLVPGGIAMPPTVAVPESGDIATGGADGDHQLGLDLVDHLSKEIDFTGSVAVPSPVAYTVLVEVQLGLDAEQIAPGNAGREIAAETPGVPRRCPVADFRQVGVEVLRVPVQESPTPGVRTSASALCSATVQVTTRTSARGSGWLRVRFVWQWLWIRRLTCWEGQPEIGKRGKSRWHTGAEIVLGQPEVDDSPGGVFELWCWHANLLSVCLRRRSRTPIVEERATVAGCLV